MEEEVKQLKQQVQDLSTKLDLFLDLYYRTNFPDKMVMTKKLVLLNQDIETEGTLGSSFGQSGSKLSVYGETPVVQAAAISAPSTPGGTYAQAEAQSVVNAINAIRTALANFGITA